MKEEKKLLLAAGAPESLMQALSRKLGAKAAPPWLKGSEEQALARWQEYLAEKLPAAVIYVRLGREPGSTAEKSLQPERLTTSLRRLRWRMSPRRKRSAAWRPSPA